MNYNVNNLGHAFFYALSLCSGKLLIMLALLLIMLLSSFNKITRYLRRGFLATFCLRQTTYVLFSRGLS